MNILVIHEVDWLKKVVYEVHDVPELLSLRGHNVTVIDYEEEWQRRHPLDLARWRTDLMPKAHRVCKNAGVELRRPGLVKIPGLDRLSSLPSQYLEIERTIRKKQIDVILLYAIPTSGLSAIWLAKRSGVPVIFRSIDVMYRMRPGLSSPAVWLAERVAYPAIDRIVALTPRLKKYVCRHGARPENVEVLMFGINQNLFRPQPKDTELLRKYQLRPDDKIAMFLGTMFDFCGLDHVIENFDQVLRAVPNARLLLVGGGQSFEHFRQLARARGLERKIVFTGFAPIDMLPRLINCADIAFNSFRNTPTTEHIFPEKTLKYLACGKAVVQTPLPGVMDILKGEKHGVLYREPGREFANGMIELFSDDKRAAQLGQNALKYIQQHHNWGPIIGRYEAIFAEEIARKQGVKQRQLPKAA